MRDDARHRFRLRRRPVAQLQGLAVGRLAGQVVPNPLCVALPYCRLRSAVFVWENVEYKIAIDWKGHAKVSCTPCAELTVQLYVRKHKDEPLALIKLKQRDETKYSMEIQPRALVPGPHALYLDGQVSRLTAYALIHARHIIIVSRQKCAARKASSLTDAQYRGRGCGLIATIAPLCALRILYILESASRCAFPPAIALPRSRSCVPVLGSGI